MNASIATAQRAHLRRVINALVDMRRLRVELRLDPDPAIEDALIEARAELKALTAELVAA